MAHSHWGKNCSFFLTGLEIKILVSETSLKLGTYPTDVRIAKGLRSCICLLIDVPPM